MKRIHPLIFLATLIVIILGTLFFSPPFLTVTTPPPAATSTTPIEATYPPLDKMIGQLFMIGHWANQPVASTTDLLKAHHIGGVIIMSAPEDPLTISDWVTGWNNAVDSPLFVAIDQEGGPVSRLKQAPYATTSQRQITTPEQAYTIGLARGADLHNLGINLNFAPVLETANNPNSFLYERAFPAGSNRAALASALISGMATSHVAGVVKHFPGHADTPDDSHATLPEVSISRSGLDIFTNNFRSLIKQNPPIAIMTAHVRYPLIDNQPATLSHFFLTDYLRDELDFAGVIITDDLIMQAIATTTPSDAAAVQAILAGADISLFAAEPEKVTAAIAAVQEAVIAGTINEARIRASYDRIIAAKETLQLEP